MKEIVFKNRKVGADNPLYFIADIGANHEGSIERAYKLIELAKEAGADAAKFQNFQAHKIVSRLGFEKLGAQVTHQKNWKKGVYEVYEEASIAKEWTSKLKNKCIEIGIDYFTSPYDLESVDIVDEFVDIYKIGSGDITWPEIIEYIAKKGKPVILATGASNIEDVDRAIKSISKYNSEIILMQCNTNYTLDIDKYKYVNLNVLKTYHNRFPNIVLGLSDHTLGHATILGAVALGARVFEKHFTDNNEREGPDHKFAMNPVSWKEMVVNANQLFNALGDGVKRIEENEKQAIIVQQRSLRAAADFKQGHIISEYDLVSLRPIPEDGIQPYRLNEIIGKCLKVAIKREEHITNKHF